MHGIWSEVQFTRPGHSTVIQPHLLKPSWISKHSENPGIWRMHHTRHIDHPFKAIGKRNPQPKAR